MTQLNRVSTPPKATLFGVDVSITAYDPLVAYVMELARVRQATLVDFMCVHGLVHATRNEQFRRMINDFDVVATDGQPVRWAMNRFHQAGLSERVYGPETMWRTCAAAEREGVRIYLYGAAPRTLQRLHERLLEAFPALQIVGAESPPFRKLTDEEHDQTARRVNDSGAQILMIGIGCPKQEEFAWRHRMDIDAVQMCVGAAFDLHAGEKSMAPLWMQRRGLEWLYRLTQEPGRLWKRYLVNNSIFAGLVIRRWLLDRSGSPERARIT